MDTRYLFFIFLSMLAGLNLGTIRRAEDPIRDTQTNPILYEQKKEEEKDGKKGPLLYHVKNYPREGFFIDLPYEAGQKGPVKEPLKEVAAGATDLTGWWEEQPTVSQETPLVETTAETMPGSLSEEEQVLRPEGAEPVVSETDTQNVPEAGKGDDYWW